VLLDDQDRSTWNRDLIDHGTALLDRAGSLGRPGPFQLQAAIAALHAQAPSVEETDWVQIAALYTALLPSWSSPSTRIAHAVAIGMADGPDAGLAVLDHLPADQGNARILAGRGHLLERAGRFDEATIAFEAAAGSAQHPREAERLRRRARDTAGRH
jgi:RNA polymerase sigma-70 factor (ECF subfamily)